MFHNRWSPIELSFHQLAGCSPPLTYIIRRICHIMAQPELKPNGSQG